MYAVEKIMSILTVKVVFKCQWLCVNTSIATNTVATETKSSYS